MKKIALLLFLMLTLTVNFTQAKNVKNEEITLTKEQMTIIENFQKERLDEIAKIENEIKGKKQEIEVVKNVKIAQRAQKERIDKLNKEIKSLEKQLKKEENKYQKDFVKKYNSVLTKEQVKTMKLKNQSKFINKPQILPSYPDNIKKERQ